VRSRSKGATLVTLPVVACHPCREGLNLGLTFALMVFAPSAAAEVDCERLGGPGAGDATSATSDASGPADAGVAAGVVGAGVAGAGAAPPGLSAGGGIALSGVVAGSTAVAAGASVGAAGAGAGSAAGAEAGAEVGAECGVRRFGLQPRST
jgi:hypothetical protein